MEYIMSVRAMFTARTITYVWRITFLRNLRYLFHCDSLTTE